MDKNQGAPNDAQEAKDSASFCDDQSAIPSEPRGSAGRFTETVGRALARKYRKQRMVKLAGAAMKRGNSEEILRNDREQLLTRYAGGLKNATHISNSGSSEDLVQGAGE